MNWFALATIGHLANAGAFLIDKTLLSSALKRSATYAALISSFSFLALVATPWVSRWPRASSLWMAIAFGAIFVFALWAFFEALRRAEATRVVPVVGSLIPVFTFLGTFTLLGERLTARLLAGYAFLIVAIFFLTFGARRQASNRKSFLLSLLAALLFAISSLLGKMAYTDAPFLGAFIISRVSAGVVGLLMIFSFSAVRNEIIGMFRKKSLTNQRVAPLAILGQMMGASGFVLVHLALASGSAPIVNSLQALQYAFLVLCAWFGGARVARALHEERTKKSFIIKSAAIVLVGMGLYLIGSAV